MSNMALRMMPLLLVFLVLTHQAGAQLTISVTTFPPPKGDGTPNTFIGTGSQFAASLLGSSTPALMWGVVPSSDVNAVCTQIVNTGTLSFSATLTASSGATETLQQTITNVGGCLAAADGSGTQAVMVDSNGRQSAVVCPNNAGATGCGVFLAGPDVTALYNQGSARRRLLARMLLQDDCKSGAAQGALTGVATVMDACQPFIGPLYPFCAVGVILVATAGGAAVGCAEANGCFPGDATVILAGGEVKRMSSLALGDKVAVRRHDGGLDYEDIYAFGHKDASAAAKYVHLSLKPVGANMSDPALESTTLELTPLHFTVISSGSEISYKRARDVRVGDMMWAQASKHAELSLYLVTDISTVVKQGLYNPYTLGGTIIVNGVVASAHSEWFLDATFDALGVTHWLPNAYQMVLAPVRLAYYAMNKQAYLDLYHRLDATLDVAQFGTKYAGPLFTAAAGLVSTIIVSALIIYHSHCSVNLN
ncbi:hypothetical protein KC19_8G174400 [Ceratodon purpureus]|uniref:Hint domain-containing protein n=1 Tax=Ceratodon purpureus TaxID=3225 RepID=A0A8T0H4Z8_CERPU|nr:hypothetical protein KC19_8G174400 [Ceratodon purpureus]